MIPPESARQLAGELASLRADVDALKRSGRRTQLTYSSLQDSSIRLYLGDEVRARIGQQSDGQAAVVYMGGDPPPAPTQPVVSARQLAFVVGWYGTFAGDAPMPSNFQRVDIHVSETAGFVPSGDTAWASLFGPGAVGLPGDVDVKYVKLVAVSNSGVASEPSIESSVTPLPADFIAAGAVGAEQLAADIILASRILMQNTSGDVTMELDGSTGDLMVSGEVRTSDTGERLVIPAGLPQILGYPATGSQYAQLYTSTYFTDAGTDYALIALRGPTYTSGRALVAANPDGAFLGYYDTAGGYYRSYVLSDRNHITVSSPDFVAFRIVNSSGAQISNAALNYGRIYAENRPVLRSPAANTALVWSTPEKDLAVTAYDGVGYRPIRASAFTVPSGRRHKRGIKRSDRPMSTIVADAPIHTWTMPGSPAGTDTSRDADGQEHTVDIPAIGDDPSQFGPLMEDLPPDMHEADDTVSLDKKINTLWGAVREILDRLDALESRLPARS